MNGLHYTGEQQFMVWIAWVGSVAYSFGCYLNSVFRGINKFQYESAAVSAFNLVQFAGAVVLLLNGGSGVQVLMLYASSRILYVLISYYFFKVTFKGEFSPYNRRRIIELTKIMFPFGVHAILGIVYLQVDTVFISYYWNSAEVGLYQAGMRMVVASMVLYEIATLAFYPLLSKSNEQEMPVFHKYSFSLQKYMTLLGMALALPLLVFAEEIIPLLFGGTFARAAHVVRLLAVVIFIRFFAAAYGVILTVSREQSKRALGVLISVVVNVILNIFLVQWYGGVGAAITSIITHVVLFAVYLFYAYKSVHRTFITSNLVVALCMLCTIGAISYYMKPVHLTGAIIVLGVAMFGVVVLFLDETEKQRIRQFIHRLV